MKIIQLIYSLSSGGAERFVVSLSNQLVELGHEVTICMLLSDDERTAFNMQFANPKVRIHTMRFKSGFTFKKVKCVEQFIIAEMPDVVHCHLNVIPYIFRLSLRFSNICFVHTLHSVAENASGKKYQKLINRFFYSRGLVIPVTISKQCQYSFVDYYNLPAPVIIDNGCDKPSKTSLFKQVCLEVDSYKSDPSSPVFIHVARYHEQKNQIMLIEAFNELDSRGEDFILLVLGDGFTQGEGAELKAKACEKIHFLGLKNNVADYLYCSDAFCLTSIYEGLPISLLEAIACGVVPICTNVGGIADVIEDGKIGFLSQVISVDSYVSTLLKFLTSQENVSRETLISKFNNEYSMELCAKNYQIVYNSLEPEERESH